MSIFCPVWPWNLMDDLKKQIPVKIGNNRAPLLCCFKLCALFHCHMWIQTGVRVRKRLSGVLTSVTLTFDLWPWPFAWLSLLSMVIRPENFMMIWWWEHGERGVTDWRTDGLTDRRTDRRTDWTSHVAAWSQLTTPFELRCYLDKGCIGEQRYPRCW